MRRQGARLAGVEEGGRERSGAGPVHAVRVQPDPQRRGDAAAHPDLRGDDEDLEEGRVVEVVLGGGVQEGGQDVRRGVRGRHGGQPVTLRVERPAGVGVQPRRGGAEGHQSGEEEAEPAGSESVRERARRRTGG